MRSSWQKFLVIAKYNAKCLVALYNATDRVKTSEQTDNHTTEVHYARAFAQLFAFIEDTLTNRENALQFLNLFDCTGKDLYN